MDIEARLAEREEQLRSQLRLLTQPVSADEVIGFGKRIGDGTSQAIQAMANASSAQNIQLMLDEVWRAQAKLAEGTYGKCDTCGQPINPQRLDFRPWSTLCIKHAS
uniref:TraR/DksA family transcriptional regulator n=1 Tax=Vaginimicrobium propionicum TaxID=1871034 RepID=UPI0009704034|nr:TraR/DksA C4-type zinc finger protein [Vaginimicrobium propionicum]